MYLILKNAATILRQLHDIVYKILYFNFIDKSDFRDKSDPFLKIINRLTTFNTIKNTINNGNCIEKAFWIKGLTIIKVPKTNV